MLSVGQKIAVIRLGQNMTQAALAKKSSVPQARISEIERGKRDMTLSTFLTLCRALDVLPAEFFSPDRRPLTEPLSRSRLERIARVVWDFSLAKSHNERITANLLGQILPLVGRPHLSQKAASTAWNSLRKMYSEQEIKTLTERVRGEEYRRNAKKSY